MFTSRAFALLNDRNIFDRIRKVMSDYLMEHNYTPSIRSMVNMVEFISCSKDCTCPYAWSISVNYDRLLKLDLCIGLNISVSLVFHREPVVDYKVKMPSGLFEDSFSISGEDCIKSMQFLIDKVGLTEYIESGRIKAKETN